MTNKKAIIIGCGIAGPILALSLQRSGIDSTIYEAQKKHSDNMGLMIYLNPSGCNILETFGLYDKVKRVSVICKKIKINSHDGKNIVNFDQSNHKEVFGVHTLAIKRGDLNKILREEVELKGIKIERGKRLTHIENTKTRSTTAFFEDGTNVIGDFIVGCDGINSKVRQIIMPDALPPKFTGSYVIGGMTDTIPINTKPKNTICFNLGKKSVFIYHITSMGQAIWGCDIQISKKSLKEKTNLSNDEWKKIIMSRHKDDDIFFRKLIEYTEQRLVRLSIYDLPTLPAWHKGVVCLTGDAAHAVTPHAGQGASLSMESAMTLGKCLRDIPDTEQAFTKYHNLQKKELKKYSRSPDATCGYFRTRIPCKDGLG